jgi:L-alanine-DL-glutamate epimerase-like enolase superfamily enzyme
MVLAGVGAHDKAVPRMPQRRRARDVKITAVEAIPYAIPYRRPLHFASGEVHTAAHVLVRVHTDDGVVGTADAPPRPFTYGETQTSIRAVIDDLFAPAVLGLSVLEREIALARMNRTVANPVAKAALDMAIWDALGKTLGVSASELLGGFTDRMRVSHMVGFAPAAQMVDEALAIREQYGITTFKVKVGRDPWTQDVEACRALRAALGPEVELYIDGNRGWTPGEAARALRAMAELDLTFAEELCPADDVIGRRWLVEQCSIPFFADESVSRAGEVTRELLAGAATGISLKTSRTGFTAGAKLLGLCEGLGADVVIGNQIDTGLGSLAAVAFGAAFPLTARRAGELSNFLDLSDDLLAEPLRITAGILTVRQGPGLGAELDEDKLTHYRQDR